MIKRINAYLSDFSRRVKIEVWQTKEAGIIASKYMNHKKVSEPERKFMMVQLTDIVKIVCIGIPFAVIPGASILMPIIIKISSKAGINLLPSAFIVHHNKVLQQNDVKTV